MAEEEKPRFNFSDPNAKPVIPSSSATPTATPAAPRRSTAEEFEPQSNPVRLILGLIAGLAVGLLLGWLYALFVSATHIGFALITAGIGWVIGFTVLVIGGQTGLITAILTALVAAISLFASRYMLVGMEIDRLGPDAEQARQILQSDPIGITFKSFGWSPMSIVILLIGVFGAFKLTMEDGVSHE